MLEAIQLVSILISVLGGVITGYFASGDLTLPFIPIGTIFLIIGILISPSICVINVFTYLIVSFIIFLKYMHVPPALERW